MSSPAASITLLLPARERFGGQSLPPGFAAALGRADAWPAGEPGGRAQLLRHFELVPRHWPVAALTRCLDANDADSAQWLRADPAWIRPDINGARLMAIGEGMALAREDAEALLPALRTLFGDAGFPIDAPDPARWYLRLPQGARTPDFATPDDALGRDLSEFLDGANAGDAGSRRWRTLASEAQVILHNHPWNERRVARGLAPVNSLWFWGGGVLPDHVATPHACVLGEDSLLRALATRAGAAVASRGQRFEVRDGSVLVDLRDARDLTMLAQAWLSPALVALQAGRAGRLQLDFADGTGATLLRRQRWRFWRRAPANLLQARASGRSADDAR